MAGREHRYEVRVEWSGNLGSGTSGYRTYARDHWIEVAGHPRIPGSSDPVFRGDPARYNPEELLVAALSACHMLAYLQSASRGSGLLTESGTAGRARRAAAAPPAPPAS